MTQILQRVIPLPCGEGVVVMKAYNRYNPYSPPRPKPTTSTQPPGGGGAEGCGWGDVVTGRGQPAVTGYI